MRALRKQSKCRVIRDEEYQETYTRRAALPGTEAGVAMELSIVVQSGPLIHAFEISQREGIPTHRGVGEWATARQFHNK